MPDALGASQEAWHHWSVVLGLTEHLLPVVANPDATISPDSKVRLLGKTPTQYNFRGEAAGIAKWTELRSTLKQVGKWELEPDYGICVQSRQGSFRAIDIDVPSEKKSRRIVAAIEGALPLANWKFRRTREGTGKLLLPFTFGDVLPKRVLQVDGGAIEILGDGQQWIAESSYLQGNAAEQVVNGRYLWPNGWPTAFEGVPLLSPEDLEELCATLELLFAVDDKGWQIARIKRERPEGLSGARPGASDPVGDHLLKAGWVRDEGSDGRLFITCPWQDQHTSDSGPTETQYAPPDENYVNGHFKCLHAHCTSRTDSEFLDAVGYQNDLSDAPELPDDPEPGTEIEKVEPQAPRYMTDKQGRKEAKAFNHELFLRSDASPFKIAWDDFTANVIRAPASDPPGEERWKLFADEHYSAIVRQMDRHGFVTQAPSSIRAAVYSHAMEHKVDTAMEWANRLSEWDGVPRIEEFWIRYAGAEDTPYVRAVGNYSWTAQAGRLLDPGCQADMVPILVGAQGARKTSLIRAIAPSPAWFGEINLLERDTDTSRKMRGKLVAELGELRGMHHRDKEDVKAFVTRRDEEWVPKYQEFAKSFKRRFVFYGTTNREDFLADETGERRWLPFRVGDDKLDVEGVERDRAQLWAEAIHMWRLHGVMWEDAERLAESEHEQFKEFDEWTPRVRAWLFEKGALDDPELAPIDMDYQWGTNEVLVGAIGIHTRELNRGLQTRVGAILIALGCTKKRVWGKGNLYRAYRRKLGGELDDLLT